MGQKINPFSNRLPLKGQWQSRWFSRSTKEYREYLNIDLKIREFIKSELEKAGLGSIIISRSRDKLAIKVITSRPGLVIGRGGAGINQLKEAIQKRFYPHGVPAIRLDIIEEKNPDRIAQIVAQNIGNQIEKRIPYRRAAKQAIEKVMASKAKGVKIIISGRLNGAEIARDEKFTAGSMPLSVFKENIDYAVYPAKTTYGIIGVKVWINHEGVEREEED